MGIKTTKRTGKPEAGGPPADPLFWAADKLKEAEQLRLSKNLTRARRICEDLLERFPDYVGALHTLGLVLADLDKLEESVAQLSKAAMYCPRDWRILTALSNVNLQLKRAETARVVLEQAQQLKPGDPVILGTLAEIYRNQKEYELAARTFEQVIEIDPSLQATQYPLSDCYEHLGWLDKSAALYEQMIDEGQLTRSLVSGIAQLPKGFTDLDALALFEKLPPPAVDEVSDYEFAEGVALHCAGRFEEAWPHIVTANQEKYRVLHKVWEGAAAYRRRALDFAGSLPVLEEAPPLPDDHPLSLFILGPTRSGKTTFERAFSTLPGVKRGYENPIVENNVRRTLQISGCITRGGINGMPPALDTAFRDFYLEELKGRASEAKVFTNTHPAKLNEVLRYARSLPGCRFVFVKRDIGDITLRTYMKNYADGNAYAFDIKTIKEHLEWYYGLADICVEKLPGMTCVVHYEELIENPKAVLHTVGELCGLKGEAEKLPVLGDDRSAADPYRDTIQAMLT